MPSVKAASPILVCLLLFLSVSVYCQENTVWSINRATAWYEKQPWLVGSNYAPAYAINQLEFWQASTFDTASIDKELRWAEQIGMNTMRVFLHDLLYAQDPQGFLRRIQLFLNTAQRHHIRPLFVLFDSVWDPFPRLGVQREPVPGVHNSGWVQSPGANGLEDTLQYGRLKAYVLGVVGRFAQDGRILGWDVWNEPDNTNGGEYHKEEPANKIELVNHLLVKVFQWARCVRPVQPLTSGVWTGEDWSAFDKLSETAKIQISNSDIISFHSYDSARLFEKRIQSLLNYNRPIVCTEYMARPRGSTFETILPLAKRYHIAVFNWGFVQGKSQTNYPWDSWDKPYTTEPAVWFHDIFHTNGTPYRKAETDFIRKVTGTK